MDTNPTVVAHNALLAGKEDLKRSAERIAAVLVEQLKGDLHFAEFKISVNCRIWKPGCSISDGSLMVAKANSIDTFTIFSEREPGALLE